MSGSRHLRRRSKRLQQRRYRTKYYLNPVTLSFGNLRQKRAEHESGFFKSIIGFLFPWFE
jgi:hypothetical protein